jgi:glucose/mannose-6-phosphate isomerase
MAKHLAFAMFEHEPKILGSGILNSVARRWKNQLSENSKNFSSFDSIPEAMHNSLEGISFPKLSADESFYVLLRNSLGHPEEAAAIDSWSAVLEEKNISFELLEATGDDLWSQKFSLILLGDWTSFYLAILNSIDPTPVPTIEKYK